MLLMVKVCVLNNLWFEGQSVIILRGVYIQFGTMFCEA